jgi:hypothetical protein
MVRLQGAGPRASAMAFAVALMVTKWGLPMSTHEEISGQGARDFGLASQVEWECNWANLVASPRIFGRLGVMNYFPSCLRRGAVLHGGKAVKRDVAQGSRFSPSADGRHFHRDPHRAERMRESFQLA